MSSLAQIRDLIKTRYRETVNDNNDLIDSYINQAYRKFCRQFRFPQLLVEGTTIASVAGTEQYTLATNFFKMAESGVRYDVTSTSQGTRLSEVSAADLQAWKLVNETSAPMVWAITAASSGSGKRIEFRPSFTETGKTIEYDYYKTPSDLVEDLDEPVVNEIEDMIVYEALVQLAIWHNDADMAQMFRAEAREQRNTMIQLL